MGRLRARRLVIYSQYPVRGMVLDFSLYFYTEAASIFILFILIVVRCWCVMGDSCPPGSHE